MFFKIGVLKISAMFTGKHRCWSLLGVLKIFGIFATQVFSCENCKNFKSSFLYREPLVTASGSTLKRQAACSKKSEESGCTLRKMCPYLELLWSAFFPHLDWKRRDTKYFSVFRPNAVKMGTRTTPNMDTFYAVVVIVFFVYEQDLVYVFIGLLFLRCLPEHMSKLLGKLC